MTFNPFAGLSFPEPTCVPFNCRCNAVCQAIQFCTVYPELNPQGEVALFLRSKGDITLYDTMADQVKNNSDVIHSTIHNATYKAALKDLEKGMTTKASKLTASNKFYLEPEVNLIPRKTCDYGCSCDNFEKRIGFCWNKASYQEIKDLVLLIRIMN